MALQPEVAMVQQSQGGGMANCDHGNGLSSSAAALRNGILVGATLVATLAFQAAVTPPGGFWQDDLIVAPGDTLQKNHTAGNPIWRDKYPSAYRRFRILNMFAFALSVGAIQSTVLWAPGRRPVWPLILPAVNFCVSLLLVAAAFSISMKQQEL